MAALAWPTMLLSLSEVIDNAWSVAANKSRLAGKILADALISRAHGSRPITLVGYSGKLNYRFEILSPGEIYRCA